MSRSHLPAQRPVAPRGDHTAPLPEPTSAPAALPPEKPPTAHGPAADKPDGQRTAMKRPHRLPVVAGKPDTQPAKPRDAFFDNAK
jgi:hypothetical protein